MDSGEQRPLTSAWSTTAARPGRATADAWPYVSASDGSAQIHVRWMDTGQAARITNLTEAPQGLAWSPDGKWMAFAMRVAAGRETAGTAASQAGGAEWAPPVKVIDRLIYRVDGAGYVDPGYTQLFVVADDGGTAPGHPGPLRCRRTGMDARRQGADLRFQPPRRLGVRSARAISTAWNSPAAR